MFLQHSNAKTVTAHNLGQQWIKTIKLSVKGITDPLRCRGRPCNKKNRKLAPLRFHFCFLRLGSNASIQQPQKTKNGEAKLHHFLLRRERDSNPRYSKEYNGFRDRPIRPLWHLSLRGQTFCLLFFRRGGERGIRTPGTLASSTVFKTAAFDHSAISPSGAKVL